MKLNTYLARLDDFKKVYLDVGLCAPSGADGPVSIEVDGKEQFRIESMPAGTVLRLKNLAANANAAVVSFTVANAGKQAVGVAFVRMDAFNPYVFIRKFSW
jgi:hypothetical protein